MTQKSLKHRNKVEVLTPEIVKQLLEENPSGDGMIWKHRSRCMFTSQGQFRAWNSRWAGKPAFTATDNTGYLQGNMAGHHLKAHRVIWALRYGEWPIGPIDHIDGNRANNRADNLRVVTKLENARNCAIPSTNTSGIIGVSWIKRKSKWRAEIRTGDDRKMSLGYYYNIEDAAKARKAAEQKYGYHPNHGRKAAPLQRRAKALTGQRSDSPVSDAPKPSDTGLCNSGAGSSAARENETGLQIPDMLDRRRGCSPSH